MQKPNPTPGVESEALPPPYSSLVPSREYSVRHPVLATAPYPVTPDSEQPPQPTPTGVPPPYYYYNNPVPTGTSGSGVTVLPSGHNLTYTPAIYNPVGAATPITQRRTRGESGIRHLISTACVMLFVIVIVTIMGLGIKYYVQEVL